MTERFYPTPTEAYMEKADKPERGATQFGVKAGKTKDPTDTIRRLWSLSRQRLDRAVRLSRTHPDTSWKVC